MDWLDRIVDAINHLNSIAMENSDIIAPHDVKKVHMSAEGFNKLAHEIGAVITYNPNWTSDWPDTGEVYFIYKGIKVFTLWTKKGDKT